MKRLRSRCTNVSNVVDGLSSSSEPFADRYSTLYTSVSYNAEELSKIGSELNHLMSSSESGSYSAASVCDVLSAIKLFKAGKCDGSYGLSTDDFIHACSELGTHISMMFSALLVHGFTPEGMISCTLIPIPTGKNVNATDSGNYSF